MVIEAEDGGSRGDSLSLRLPVSLEVMMDATQDKMVDGDQRAYYMVPCRGALADGSPCTGYVFISLIDKTTCPVCGTVYGNWGQYLATRTKDR